MSAARFLGVSAEPRLVPPYPVGAFLIALALSVAGRPPSSASTACAWLPKKHISGVNEQIPGKGAIEAHGLFMDVRGI